MLVSFDVLGDKDGLVEHLGTSSTTSDVMVQPGPQEEELDMLGHCRIGMNKELI